MNYFKTIKAALDASYGPICRHKSISVDQAPQAVKNHLHAMNKEWFGYDPADIDYGDPMCRFAYLFAHTAANANLCEIAIRESPDVCRLTVCSQPEYLATGAGEARCVDAGRLADVAGKKVAAKEKGNREECRCSEARDIGEYDTCPHGCVYCYAVQNRQLALERYRQHDPQSEFLFPPPAGAAEQPPGPRRVELTVFDGLSEP